MTKNVEAGDHLYERNLALEHGVVGYDRNLGRQLGSQQIEKRRRVAILEFVCGGGMVTQPLKEIPTSLLREGRAMLHALASDWSQLADWDVLVCWDARLGGCDIRDVSVQEINTDEIFLDAWRKLASEVDFVVVIAPEMDNQLTEITDALRTSGACLLNADSTFLQAASDKWLTAECFQRANVPHPRTKRVGDFIKSSSALPEVDNSSDGCTIQPVQAWTIKPRDGAGCQDVYRLESLRACHRFVQEESTLTRDWNRYLIQPWIEGVAGSIAVLCGPNQLCVLPAMSQNLLLNANHSKSGVQYCGGAGPLNPVLQAAFEAFAIRVIRSLPGYPVGWIGIDFVLTDSQLLDESIVAIEVNPRLTTSYLGLREIVSENLAEIMFQAASGQDVKLSFTGRSTSFDSLGTSASN